MKKELLSRLIMYKKVAMKMRELGFLRVFSVNLADAVGISAIKVRKDFSLLNIRGNYKSGYEVDYLIKKIDKILGKDNIEKVVIVGCGNIGYALMKYPGFEKVGIKIVAGFDIDPTKIKNETSCQPIFHLDTLRDFISNEKINIAVLSVPEVAAQRVTDLLVSYGIKGILNFSPVKLKVKNCIVNDIHIEAELENLIYSTKLELQGEKNNDTSN